MCFFYIIDVFTFRPSFSIMTSRNAILLSLSCYMVSCIMNFDCLDVSLVNHKVWVKMNLLVEEISLFCY